MYKIYLRQAFMHLWVQQSAEAFKFQQYVISIVLVQECAKQNGGGGGVKILGFFYNVVCWIICQS